MANKAKTAFFCRNCGFESSKWLGKCPSCNEWNTFTEEVIERPKDAASWKDSKPEKRISGPVQLSEITASDTGRLVTSDLELNRTLGGGIVAGSLVLIGGEPGIGKS
ncbi:MAG TPA: DNA repair protein RadA, partial [Chitinophagales bacterium]|nr:DNA repair protein RadA [Chitinophagales bacterium]